MKTPPCLLIAIVCLLSSVCSGQDGPEPAAPELTERLGDRCQALLDALVGRGISGASAALVLPGGEVVARAAGVADVDTGEPLTTAGRMLSGSVGKTYVTGVVQRLLTDGLLTLDERPLATEGPEWLSRVPNAREATLRQLMTHTSGIPRYVFEPAFAAQINAAPEQVWTHKERFEYLFDAEPLFAPGADFAYSDSNYLLVGMAIEHVTGRSFYELAHEWLIAPHGLSDTVPTDRVDVPGVVQGHVFMGGGLGVPERTLHEGRFVYNVQFEWCGGGWASTPADLARWAGILYSGEAVEGDYLPRLLDTVSARPLGPGVEYGLCVMVRDTEAGQLLGHDGFMPGYLSTMGYFPESKLAFAIQLNTDDARRVGRPLHALLVELAQAVQAELAH